MHSQNEPDETSYQLQQQQSNDAGCYVDSSAHDDGSDLLITAPNDIQITALPPDDILGVARENLSEHLEVSTNYPTDGPQTPRQTLPVLNQHQLLTNVVDCIQGDCDDDDEYY